MEYLVAQVLNLHNDFYIDLILASFLPWSQYIHAKSELLGEQKKKKWLSFLENVQKKNIRGKFL